MVKELALKRAFWNFLKSIIISGKSAANGVLHFWKVF